LKLQFVLFVCCALSLKQGAAIFLGLKRVEIMLTSFTVQQVQHFEDAFLSV
jgi:hypothetical protein